MSEDVAEQLAADLVRAHRRVRLLDVDNDPKAIASRRLLAISHASKHDVVRAARRLETFLQDLDEGRISGWDRADEG